MPELIGRTVARGAIIAAVWAASIPAGALAQEHGAGALRALPTTESGRGFEAVGRLDIGAGNFCTGALIAPDQVLTAAHCLFDRQTGQLVPPDEITFLAGWRNGRASAYRAVRRLAVHPQYVYRAAAPVEHVPHDIALIELAQPIRLPQMAPFEIAHEPRRGDQVGIVSYARDRAEAPSLQELCEVLDAAGGMIILSCQVEFGASGAPVLLLDGTVPRVVSVVSAKAEWDAREVALGTSLREQISALRQALHDSGTRFVRPGGAVPAARLEPHSGREDIGARFIRP